MSKITITLFLIIIFHYVMKYYTKRLFKAKKLFVTMIYLETPILFIIIY